jgi:hypothetical protein
MTLSRKETDMASAKEHFPPDSPLAPSQLRERSSVSRRVDALFLAMASDFLLREKFVTNPAQMTAEYVYGKALPQPRATAINQLFYSVVSNQKLLSWLRSYSARHRGNQPSARQFLTDFGEAVVEHGGQYVVYSLIGSSLTGTGLSFDDSLLNVVFSGGSRIMDGTDGGTVTTPPKTGGQEGGPATNKKRELGFLSRGYVVTTLDAAIQYATDLRDAGALDIALSESQ